MLGGAGSRWEFLLEMVDALIGFLYQFHVLRENDLEIDWIVSVLFLYSNQELGGEVIGQCRCLSVLCASAGVVLCRMCTVFVMIVLCTRTALVIYNLWILVAGRQVTCRCFHRCRSIESWLERVQCVHGLSAL